MTAAALAYGNNAGAGDAVFTACLAFDRITERAVETMRLLAAEQSVGEILLYCRESSCDKPFSLWRGGEKIRQPIERDKKSAPLSLVAARGAMAQAAEFPYLLFFDQHTRPDAGLADALAEELREAGEDALIFPPCRDIGALSFRRPDDYLLFEGLGLRPGGAVAAMLRRSKTSPYAEELADCAYPPVCTFAVPTRVFRALGGFDPNFPHSAAEEFCLHAATAGIKPRPSARVSCDNFSPPSPKERPGERKKMFAKHFDGLYRTGVINAGVLWMRVKSAAGAGAKLRRRKENYGS